MKLLGFIFALLLASPVWAATQTLILYQSNLEGGSLSINYDDVAMTASSISAANPSASASNDMNCWWTINGVTTTIKVTRGGVSSAIPLNNPLPVQIVNTARGQHTIFVGLQGYGCVYNAPSN